MKANGGTTVPLHLLDKYGHTEVVAGRDVCSVHEDSDIGSIESVERESSLQLYLDWHGGV